MQAVARKFQGKPVALVAVNSGSGLTKVSSYIKENRLKMPVIADVDRSLETSIGLRTAISLKNIWQARIISADGKVGRGNSMDLEASMEKALTGASWNLEPTQFPKSMQNLWQAVEFGNYSAASKPLKKKLVSSDLKEKAAAKTLHEYVHAKLKEQIGQAERLVESEQWEAWTRFSHIEDVFAGYDLPNSVSKARTKLESHPRVQNEKAALKLLALAKRAAGRSKAAQQRGLKTLKKIVQQYPDTEAAAEAKKHLQQAGEAE